MSSSDDDDVHVEEPDLAEDDPMRAFLPASFGKRTKQTDLAEQLNRSKRPVAPDKGKAPAAASSASASKPALLLGRGRESSGSGDDGASDKDSDKDSDSDDSDDSDDGNEFPVSHELVLKTHERAVSSVSLDVSGGRLLTGSTDCTVKLHDFASMTPSTLRAFKTVDPYQTKPGGGAGGTGDSHPVHMARFNHLSGGAFLCVSAHPQAKIFSRDGEVLTEFVKGDMYLRDMHNTKGHVSEITTGCWHPTDKNVCVTAGTDSTLRIWDVNNKRSQKEVIVFKSKAPGNAGRTRMTAVAWGTPAQGGNNVLVAAALDGSLVLWQGNSPFSRPAAEIRDAHKPNTWTGGVDISSDGRMVVTRGGDDTIKLWDTRKFKEPLVTVAHPSTSDHYPTTNIRYAPNSTSIVTGSATGDLHILNPGNLRPELVTAVTPGVALIAVEWHPKINQVVTGSANGHTHVLYSPSLSTRGAADVMLRAPKRRHIDDDASLTTDQLAGLSGDAILTPGSLAAARRRTGGGRGKESALPEKKHVTPFMRSQPDEKHISENIPLSKMLHEDPREALLKYADLAKKDPMFTNAWKDTQPVTQYANVSDDEQGPNKKKARR